LSYNLTEVLSEEPNGAKIKVIGVGGGGGNMVDHMIRTGVTGIELILANTDAQVLEKSLCENRIQLGEKITRGLGAGMQPEVGAQSAEESKDEIREHLEGADIVFIAAGLGGGTGTGASPVIARIAKELNALTISVVTKPFSFEGGRRRKLAEEGLEELKKESDSIVVIPNDKLLETVDKSVGMKDAFRIVDDVLSRAVSGASGIILKSGENDINLDFADLNTVMSHKGLALMGIGEAEGEKSAYEAIKNAIESPLLDNSSIDGAMGVLVHFSSHPDYSLIEIHDAMGIIHESADPDASIIFGTTTDPDLPKDFVRITLIATGFDKQEDIKTQTITKKDSPKTDPFISRTNRTQKQTVKPVSKPQPKQVEDAEVFESVEQKTGSLGGGTNNSSNYPSSSSGERTFPASHSSNGFPPRSGLGNGIGNRGTTFPTRKPSAPENGFGRRGASIDSEHLDTPTWMRNKGNNR
jgi:cell division protein FtsZ